MSESTFSVEGISAIRNEQMDKMAAEKEKEVRVRNAGRQSETMMKKMEKDREKQDKMREQRMTRILLMKVQRRFQAFPWLAEKVPPVTPKSSIVELQETDELQKLELDLQGAEERMLSMIRQGAFLVEGLWGDGSKMTFLPEKARLDLRNFGKVINSEVFMKEAEPLIVETTIEYPTIGQMNLPMRWLACVINAMLMVHQMNTNPVFKKLVEEQAMREGMQEEFLSEEEQTADSLLDETKPPRKRKPKKV